jgi:predicted CXXCH cytochrome family protein
VKEQLSIALIAALGAAACAGVLGLRPQSSSRPFEHRAHVLKGVACGACHEGIGAETATTPGEARSAAPGADGGPTAASATLHLPKTATCTSCHTKPHDVRACAGCHGEAHVREEAALARTHLRFAHEGHLARVRGDCVRCHQEIASANPGPLRPTMAVCFSCHEHQEQWSVRDCERCHVDLPAERTPPASHLVHEGDFVREHGVRAAAARDLCMSCHSERSCAACHGVGTTPALPARISFEDVRLSGLHRAGFRARHAEEAHADPGLCTTCHSESSCQSCHASLHVAAGAAQGSPHPADWLTAGPGGGEHGLAARTDPASCAGCHGGAGEQLCVGCHRVGGPGGSPHGRGFTSTKDRMRDAPCKLCHGAGP